MKTSTKDITGRIIKLGDIVDYDFEGDDPCPFEVVFEDNAFRKKYPDWDNTLTKPMLEYGHNAKRMKLKIVRNHSKNKRSFLCLIGYHKLKLNSDDRGIQDFRCERECCNVRYYSFMWGMKIKIPDKELS